MLLSDVFNKLCKVGGSVTGSQCVEIFASSTLTTSPYPPHPHAHLSKDGFNAQETGEVWTLKNRRKVLIEKVRQAGGNLERRSKLEYELAAATRQIRELEERQRIGGQEGVHLDPKTRGGFVDPNTALTNEDYTQRTSHSQFEDAETAVMALYYALNCDAGKDAIKWLQPGKGYNRACIYSKSAINGLAHMSAQAEKGPTDANKKPLQVSYHPMRGQTIQMLERGKGESGKATTTSVAIERVVTILSRGSKDELILTTHYPVAAMNLASKIKASVIPKSGAHTYDFVRFSGPLFSNYDDRYAVAKATKVTW
jgi:hypothetical protein